MFVAKYRCHPLDWKYTCEQQVEDIWQGCKEHGTKPSAIVALPEPEKITGTFTLYGNE